MEVVIGKLLHLYMDILCFIIAYLIDIHAFQEKMWLKFYVSNKIIEILEIFCARLREKVSYLDILNSSIAVCFYTVFVVVVTTAVVVSDVVVVVHVDL